MKTWSLSACLLLLSLLYSPWTQAAVELNENVPETYIVKKGDAGFWGIAQEVYGNGKYWSVLAKANPQFSSTSLKPGDRLVVPEKPAATSGPVAGGPVILPGPGQKVYVVQGTDTTG